MAKKLLSVILCIVIALCSVPMVAAKDTDAKLYNVYGDGMLFRQKTDAILSGSAKSGSVIKAELFNSDNTLTASAEAVAANGTFEISFTAPSGSYEEYTIILTADGIEFDKLENIVFGELWLASGQSNMQYALSETPTGEKLQSQNAKLSKWLRVLMVPLLPLSSVESQIPLEPMIDINGAKWINGENSDVYGMSAVAYFFAEELMKKLDMPVGVLNCSLGSSSIISWISRDAIESTPEVQNFLARNDRYFSSEEWNESFRSVFYDMTCNYNLKVYALRHFRPAGLIWYQGETDLMVETTPQEYEDQFDLLQKSYSELFKFEDKLMPIIYTELAANMYTFPGGFELPEWNAYCSEMQKAQPDSRGAITLSDVSLACHDESGFIHPMTKEPVGQRMAYVAEALVYGADHDHTAASVNSYEFKGSDVYITFDNVGDGLKVNGNKLSGFALCSGNGVYLPAEAEIINNNTVKIHSDLIFNPVSATYAYAVRNCDANLFATDNGEITMPVTPFVINDVEDPHYWVEKPWADCEKESDFQSYANHHSAYYPTWNGNDCEISFDSESAYSGEKGLNIKSSENSFSVNNIMTYVDGISIYTFRESDADFSDYKTMTFRVRNNGTEPIKLETVRFYSYALTWYSATIVSTDDTSVEIPADSEWHEITLDLNKLYLTDTHNGLIYPNNMLDEVKEIRLVFSSEVESDISLDNFTFSSESYNARLQYNPDFSFIDSLVSFFRTMWPSLVEWITKLVTN